jgi:class 3 adenylate cyclase
LPGREDPLSFRVKLLLAMLVVVVSVTGATLLVIQQSVERAYARVFEERFESDVSFFSVLRAARLAVARSRCLDLAGSVRLLAAIDERDAALLYRIAADELRNLLRPPAEAPDRRAATFFRFVDAAGVVLPPADERAGVVDAPHPARWEEQVAHVATRLGGDVQQVGWLAPEVGGAPVLQEVVVTRIVDRATGRRLGALAIGFPADDSGDRATDGGRPILGGIWLEGRLHSRTIPAEIQPALARTVGEEIAGVRDVAFAVEGVRHRVFERALTAGSAFPPAYQVGLYSMADAHARQRDLRRAVLGFGAAGLVVALVLSVVMSRGLAVPIRELVAAAGEVGRGNLAVAVPVRSHDEIGRLAASFNDMVGGLALKERYRSVLDLVADKEVARELVEGRLALGGELREVSVVFCDIRGFTTLTEHMAPADVIELLNEHMSVLTRVVHAAGGVVDKFVGDSLIALFGAPRTTGRDAEHAVRAAWRMIAEREALNRVSRHRLEIGIGIASGTVVAGCMGSADRLDYPVLGARVNLAARLCAQAAGMELLVDEETRRQLEDDVRLEPVPPLVLKGFSTPVAAYRVLWVGAAAASS